MADAKTYVDQVILAAIGLDEHGVIMGYRGDGVPAAMIEGDGVPTYRTENIFPLAGYPEVPGIYIWRGTIKVEWIDEGRDFMVDMIGLWSPPSSVDMALVGVADPKIDQSEDD